VDAKVAIGVVQFEEHLRFVVRDHFFIVIVGDGRGGRGQQHRDTCAEAQDSTFHELISWQDLATP
jgi:hypothetical protein